MADINNSTVLTGGIAADDSLEIASYQEDMENYQEQQDNILNASTEDYLTSMRDNMAKSNTLAKAINWAVEESYANSFDPQEGYEIDDEEIASIIETSNIDWKYADVLKESKSPTEFQFRLLTAKREAKMDEQINNSLSQTDRTVSTVGGALFDVDIMLGMGIGMMYGKSASMAKVLAWEAAAETGIGTAHVMFDDEYKIEDALFDGMIGIGVAFGAKNLIDHLGRSKNTDNVDGDVRMIKDDMDIKTPEQNRFKFFEKQRELEAGSTTNRRAADDAVNEAFDPRDNFMLNRKTFFGKQEEIVEGAKVKAPAREQLSQEKITTIESDLAKAKAHVDTADTPRKAKIRQKKVDTLRDELATTKQELDDYKFGTIKGLTEEETRFHNMVDDLALDMKATVDDINLNIKNNDVAWMKQNQDVVEELAKRYPVEMEELRNLLRSKLGSSKDFIKTELKIGKMKLSKKQKALIAAAVLGTTSAQAGEGEGIGDELTAAILVFAGVALFGKKGYETIKNPNTRSLMKVKYDNAKSWMNKTESKNSPDGEELTSRKEDIANAIKTRWTSTIAPFEKAGGKVAEMAQKLVYSAKEGAGVEVTKRRRIEGALARYRKAEKFNLKQFKKETGKNQTPNVYADLNEEANFRHLVSDFIEGVEVEGGYPKSVQNFADTVRQEFKDMYGYNIENATYGFVPRKLKDGTMSKALEYKENMLPRLWRHDVHDWFKKLNEEDAFKVREAVRRAITSKLKEPTDEAIAGAEKTADKFVDRWITGSKGKTTSDDTKGSMFETIKHLMDDDVELDDYLDALNISKDKTARAKHRIDMDMEVFAKELEGITVEIDGVKTNLSKTHFVDRNIRSIFDTASHNMYTSGALSEAGFKTVKQLERSIDNSLVGVRDPQLAEDLNNIKNLILGSPIGGDPKLQNISMMAKDITLMTKLPFAVFSTSQEVVNMIGNHGIGKSLNALGTLLKNNWGKDSYMMNQLVDTYGVGTGVRRTDFSFYGMNDDLLALEDSGVTNMFRKGTMKMRDAVLLPLGAMTDVIQRMNSVMDAERIAKFVTGLDEAKGYRWDGISMDDAAVEMFKDTFEFTDKGVLKDFDISTWSAKKRDAFGNLLFEMEQRTTLTSTIGETPIFTKTDTLGRTMGTLLGYALSQFNAHTVEGVRHMDRTSAMHTVGGFMGSYIGLHARYAVQDKDVEESQIIKYSIINTPALSVIGLIQGASDPVVFETVSAINKVPATILGAIDND